MNDATTGLLATVQFLLIGWLIVELYNVKVDRQRERAEQERRLAKINGILEQIIAKLKQ